MSDVFYLLPQSHTHPRIAMLHRHSRKAAVTEDCSKRGTYANARHYRCLKFPVDYVPFRVNFKVNSDRGPQYIYLEIFDFWSPTQFFLDSTNLSCFMPKHGTQPDLYPRLKNLNSRVTAGLCSWNLVAVSSRDLDTSRVAPHSTSLDMYKRLGL